MQEEEQLINAAKEGKQSAYKELLHRYWSDIFRFLNSKTNNENETEDIVIETFAKAFDKIASYKEGTNFKNWLLTIARNHHIDHLRKQKTKTISLHKDFIKYTTILDQNPSPEDQLIREQNLATLLAHIKKLKPKYQEVIQLRYFQELSYKEIAIHLEQPMSNVKVKLLRAKKILAEIIENQEEE